MMLPLCPRSFEEEDKTLTVTVITTMPLDDELRAKVTEKLEKNFNTQVYLIERNPKDFGRHCS